MHKFKNGIHVKITILLLLFYQPKYQKSKSTWNILKNHKVITIHDNQEKNKGQLLKQ